MLHNRWYDTFNFYFSKPINEILAGVSLPHVVAYKDYLYYDDETEYLKRYYKRNEVKPRMENIADFYFTLTEGMTRPTFPLHEQNPIILKRNDRLNKELLAKLQGYAGGPQPRPVLNREPNNLAANEEGLKIPNKNSQGNRDEEFKQLSNDVNVVQAKSIEITEPEERSFQRMLDKAEEEDQDKSFDSVGHDIFNPNISMEDNVKDYLAKSIDKKTNLNNFNRRKDLKAGDAFLEIPHPDKRLNNPVIAPASSVGAPQIAAAEYGSSSSSPSSAGKRLDTQSDNKVSPREFSDGKDNRQNHLLPDNVSFSKREPSPSSNSQHSESKNLGLKSQSFTNNPPFAVANFEVSGSQRSDIIVQNTKNTTREEGKTTEKETSTTRIQIEEGSKDMKYHPVITISNIQINQIAPVNGHKKEEPQPPQPQHQNNYESINNYQAQPPKKIAQPEYKQQAEYRGPSMETQFRPAETIFTEDSVEREQRPIAAPATSSDYVKDMMRKYYKVTDAELSHQVSERFKESSILARLAGLKKNNAQPQPASRDMYVNTNIRSTLIKDAPRQYTKGRIQTDASVYQSVQSFRANHSPQNSINVHTGSNTARQPTSPTNNRRSYNRVKSNEGIILLTQESSMSTNTLPTRRSPENPHSIGEFLGNDMVQTLSKGYDAVRLLQQKKAEYKHHNKSKSSSNFIFHATNLKASQASNRAQDSLPSTKAPSTHTQPPSASNKPDLRLDFASLNQGTKFENAQGFWSCRSGKSDHLDNLFSAKTPGHERNSSQVYKEDYLRQKYRQQEETKTVSSTRANYNIRPLGINVNLNKKNVSKPASFNSRSGDIEVNGSIGKIGERRIAANSRTGSISYPVKQFTNRKIGK